MDSFGKCTLRGLMTCLTVGIVASGLGDATGTCPSGWCGLIGVALVGTNYSMQRTDTQGLCHGACAAEPRCRCANYELETGVCQLIFNASHLDYPDRLILRRGWFYSYIDVEPSDEHFIVEKQGPPCLENNTNDAFDFIRTTELFASANFSLARHGCWQFGMQLCTLAELYDAYRAGFADNMWSLIDVQGRDAKVAPCSDYHWNRPGECYHFVEGRQYESLIPNTPRPYVNQPAYCCSTGRNSSDTLQWQLVFKGQGGQQISNRSLYEIWTDPHWDSSPADEGTCRDQSVYHAWNHNSDQLQLVKLSLFNNGEAQPKAQLVFSGVHSSITNWFSLGRLLASPWLDLREGSPDIFAMEGSQTRPGRHFVISKSGVECEDNVGWLFISGPSPCSWMQPFTIMYSTTKNAVAWSNITDTDPGVGVDSGVGVADYMTIHVSWNEQHNA